MKRIFSVFFILLLFKDPCFSSKPFVILNRSDVLLFKGAYLDCLEDPTGKLGITDVTSPKYSAHFTHGTEGFVRGNDHINSTYWLRMELVNNNPDVTSIAAELYDFRINTYEYYLIKDGKLISSDVGGADHMFNSKKIFHKNYINKLALNTTGTYFLYYKIKSIHQVNFIGMMRSFEKLLSYSNGEYFLLALFYGAILALAVYNLFIFFAVGDKVYLFYVLYVISVGIYSLSQDGLGFQYIWPDYPIVNEYIFPISGYFVIFWMLLYSREFLHVHEISSRIDKVFLFFIFFRFVVLLFSILDTSFSPRWIDLSILVFVYCIGAYLLISGKRSPRFFVAGFSLFFIGYLFTFLIIFNIIKSSSIVYYSFNLGVICEMLLFSFALADRIKIITEENLFNQKKLLEQAKEKEDFIHKLNKELEEIVHERTKRLEEKNRELDTFVYRSSHDIKGPIKSIIGLSSLGLIEANDNVVVREYFERLLESSKMLDNVNNNLLSLIDFKNLEIKSQEIHFAELVKQTLHPLQLNPKFSFIKFETDVQQQTSFLSDLSIIKLILKDICENAVIFADPGHKESYLSIKIEVKDHAARIQIYGTGRGIPQKHIDEIFNPFSSLQYKSEKNYLGLYLLKLHTEKINGTFNFTSTLGKGAGFDLVFKSLSLGA